MIAKRAESRYLEGRRTRDWLKIKVQRRAGVPDRRLHAWRPDVARARSARSCSPCARTAPFATSATSAPASTRPRSRSSSKLLEPLHRAAAPFDEVPKLPRVKRSDIQWVEPRARRRGQVRRVDARRAPAASGVPRAARRQGPGRGRRRTARAHRAGRRDPARQARAAAVEPRQAVLARRGNHQGRSDRVLPGGVRRDPAAPSWSTVHDAPVSRRRVRQGVLPEGRAEAHAGLDQDVRGHRLSRQDGALSDRRRRARAALDGEHGLHRHERLVLARRPAGPARLRPLRPRSDARGAVVADDRGRSRPAGAARRARPALVSEDLRRQGLSRARAARPSLDLRRHTRGSPKSSPVRSCARIRVSRRRNGRRRGGAAC